MPDECYAKIDDRIVGPMSTAKLKELAEDGRITPETAVRRGEDGEWIRAGRAKGLQPHFAIFDSSETTPEIITEVPVFRDLVSWRIRRRRPNLLIWALGIGSVVVGAYVLLLIALNDDSKPKHAQNAESSHGNVPVVEREQQESASTEVEDVEANDPPVIIRKLSLDDPFRKYWSAPWDVQSSFMLQLARETGRFTTLFYESTLIQYHNDVREERMFDDVLDFTIREVFARSEYPIIEHHADDFSVLNQDNNGFAWVRDSYSAKHDVCNSIASHLTRRDLLKVIDGVEKYYTNSQSLDKNRDVMISRVALRFAFDASMEAMKRIGG